MSQRSPSQVFVDRMKESLLKCEEEWKLDQYHMLNVAHEKSKQPRIYIVLAGAALLALICIRLLGLSFISNLTAFGPIYQSFKALRSKTKADDELWLTYWVTYGSLGLFESCIDAVFFWMPLYYIAKIVFLVWCYAPQTRGATVVYERVLGPLFGTLQQEVSEAKAEYRERMEAKKRVE